MWILQDGRANEFWPMMTLEVCLVLFVAVSGVFLRAGQGFACSCWKPGTERFLFWTWPEWLCIPSVGCIFISGCRMALLNISGRHHFLASTSLGGKMVVLDSSLRSRAMKMWSLKGPLTYACLFRTCDSTTEQPALCSYLETSRKRIVS